MMRSHFRCLLSLCSPLVVMAPSLLGATTISQGGTLYTIFRDTPVRKAPSPVSDVLYTIPSAGTQVTWIAADATRPIWQKIHIAMTHQVFEGYIADGNLSTDDPSQSSAVRTHPTQGKASTAGVVIATAATRAFVDFDPSAQQYAKSTNGIETLAWLGRLTTLESMVTTESINLRNRQLGLFPMPSTSDTPMFASSSSAPGNITTKTMPTTSPPSITENELQKCMDFGDYPIDEAEARQLSDLAAIAIIQRFGGLLLDPTSIVPGIEPLNGATQAQLFGKGINGLNQYLFMIAQNLASRTGRPTPYRLMILHTPEVNAFSTPGGDIFVTKGLLKLLQAQGNESHLALILGHEIKHILAKDGLERWKEVKRRLCLDVLQEQPPKELQELRPAMKVAISTSCQGSFNLAHTAPALVKVVTERFVNQISCASYKLDAELLADQEGLRLSILAGYRPDYGRLFSLFESTRGFSNHPSSLIRKAHLDEVFQGMRPSTTTFGYHDWPFDTYPLVAFSAQTFTPLDPNKSSSSTPLARISTDESICRTLALSR